MGDVVDGVDARAPLDVVEVALMHRVDADPVWTALRARLAADVDQRRGGVCGVVAAEHPCIRPRAAHVVQVALEIPAKPV